MCFVERQDGVRSTLGNVDLLFGRVRKDEGARAPLVWGFTQLVCEMGHDGGYSIRFVPGSPAALVATQCRGSTMVYKTALPMSRGNVAKSGIWEPC